jgi:hypothetical protein
VDTENTSETTATDDTGTGQNPAEGEPGSAKPTDDLPEWARTELSKVRSEAASYRTRLREAEKQLEAATPAADLESRITELTETKTQLERKVLVEQAARKHGLPDDLAALVQGEDAAAIEAHATALAKYAPTSGPDAESLSGGLNPSGDADDGFDPVEVAKEARASRY